MLKTLIKLNKKRFLAKMSTFNLAAPNSLLIEPTAATSPTHIKSYKEIPGPKTVPVLGSLFNIKSFGGDYDFLEFRSFQDRLQADFGDMVKWEIFNNKFVYLYNPDLIKEVYKADNSTPLRPTAEPMVKLHQRIGIKLDLINSQGERWRKLRSLANPVMARPQNIHLYLKNHNLIANDMINVIEKKFNKGENELVMPNFEQIIKLLSLEYVSELAFDHRINCVNDASASHIRELVNAIEVFFIQLGRLAFSFPFWRFFPTSDWRKFEKAGLFIYSIVNKYIEQAAQRMRETAPNCSDLAAADKKKSILEEFLCRKEKYGLEIGDVVSIMTDFLVAGVDTTSNSLYYLLYEIGTNQHIQQKLYDEIVNVVGADCKEVTSEHIEQMKYLKCIFKESMRLHSTVPANARILSRDLVLDSYEIPRGTIMLFANSYITRSERFFARANEFDPSRWEASSTSPSNHHPYAALPFGHGVRMCIGRRLAEQELYLTLIKLVQAFKIDYVGNLSPGLRTGLIAAPDQPLSLKFQPRC